MDVLDRADLPFPHSLPEFQRLFPDDAACAAYLEKARWGDGFACPHCGTAGEPFHFENRPGVLRCRKCRQNTGLTVGTVMERSHTPLNVWFWAAYLVASQTPGMSAVQFQRQLGLSRYETAFQILHKLRSGMVRPNQDRIGGQPKNHVEVDETWVGGRTRGEGRGVHHKVPVSCAIEVRHRKPGTKLDNRKDGRYAGRVRLAVVLDRSAESLCGFVESTVAPGSLIVTDDWSGYAGLGKRGYEHFAVAECGDPEVAEQYLPMARSRYPPLISARTFRTRRRIWARSALSEYQDAATSSSPWMSMAIWRTDFLPRTPLSAVKSSSSSCPAPRPNEGPPSSSARKPP